MIERRSPHELQSLPISPDSPAINPRESSSRSARDNVRLCNRTGGLLTGASIADPTVPGVATLIDFQEKDRQAIENMWRRKLVQKKQVLTYAHFVDAGEADGQEDRARGGGRRHVAPLERGGVGAAVGDGEPASRPRPVTRGRSAVARMAARPSAVRGAACPRPRSAPSRRKPASTRSVWGPRTGVPASVARKVTAATTSAAVAVARPCSNNKPR